jgi:Co/Zn/Cd efflux system component
MDISVRGNGRSSEWNHSVASGRFYLHEAIQDYSFPNGKRNGVTVVGAAGLIVNLIVVAMLQSGEI